MIKSAADQAFLLVAISGFLGACFVWAFWEIEAARGYRRHRRELVRHARRSMAGR